MSSHYTILMVAACPFPYPQGSQVLIRQLSEALIARGHKLHLITYHLGQKESAFSFPVHRIASVPTYRKLSSGPSFQKPLLDWMLSRKIIHVARAANADLIHAHNYEGAFAGYLARRKAGIPVIYHSHNALTEELPCYFRSRLLQSIASKSARIVDRFLLPRMDYCLAINEELLSFFKEQGVQEENMGILPPGIDIREFPEPTQRAEGKEFLLLYLGNLDAYQDLSILFRAFALVVKEEPRCRLVIASHSSPERCLAQAQKEGVEGGLELEHLASFGQAAKLMQKAHLAVLPRTGWSGFPIKLLNYMASGMAVVASEGSGKCLAHGETGWLVPNGNPAAFAKGILHLLRRPSLREEIEKKARSYALTTFAWDALMPELESTYEKVLSR